MTNINNQKDKSDHSFISGVYIKRYGNKDCERPYSSNPTILKKIVEDPELYNRSTQPNYRKLDSLNELDDFLDKNKIGELESIPTRENSTTTEEKPIQQEVPVLPSLSQDSTQHISQMREIDCYNYKIDYKRHLKTKNLIWAHLISCNPEIGDIFIKEPTEMVTFGRTSDCDYRFLVENVSKNHAILYLKVDFEGLEKNEVYIEDTSYNGVYVNGERIVKNKKTLLKDGDEIQLTKWEHGVKFFDDRWFIYKSTLTKPNERKNILHELRSPEERYEMKYEIGKGHYANVLLAIHRYTGIMYAVKSINKTKLNVHPEHKAYIEREVDILKKISHPFVISSVENYIHEEKFNIIFDYYPDGDLYDLFATSTRLNEVQVVRIAYQMLSALKYLHQNEIIHRDIKPENVLVVNKSNFKIVLADFGLARFSDGRETFSSLVGSASYAAPEVNNFENCRSYTETCDIWSLGVMVFVGVFFQMPFDKTKSQPIVSTDVAKLFELEKWTGVSGKMKNFIRSLLQFQKDARPSAAQALNDPLIISYEEELEDLIEYEYEFTQKPDSIAYDTDHISLR
ncbi:kinase-like protein [Neoconidiobolus thromboides FSU 785]|nr:kinase-like protein [Neoconidiobolus thromboides FSU 785]